MPTSIDPLPGENEIECARCGAIIYFELTRCPQCGVNLYEPEDDPEQDQPAGNKRNPAAAIKDLFHRLTGKPYKAEALFGKALETAHLYNDLLKKTGGDHQVVERLIAYEMKKDPQATRHHCIQNAIARWEQDNRSQFRQK